MESLILILNSSVYLTISPIFFPFIGIILHTKSSDISKYLYTHSIWLFDSLGFIINEVLGILKIR